MKNIIKDFINRGFIACGFGPIVLAVIYLILQKSADIQMLTINEVCKGIFSISVLAFIAGGMNCVYQIERLPLMAAILIHGIVLYFSYLAAYLINDWLENGIMPVIVFTVIFAAGYILIWAVIYTITKKRTEIINKALKNIS